MKWTIRKKIIITFTLIILLVLIQSAVIQVRTKVNETAVKHSLSKGYAGALLTKELELDVVRVQQWLTDISATRAAEGFDIGFDEAEKYANMFEQHKANLLTIRPDLRKELTELTKSFEKYYEKGQWMAQEYIREGPELGNKAMGELDPYAEDVGNKLKALVVKMNKAADKSIEKALALNDFSKNIGLIVNLFIVVVTIIVAIALSTKISRSIKSCIDYAKAMLAGKSSVPLEAHNEDETGDLVKSLNQINGILECNQEVIEENLDMGKRVVSEFNRTASKLSEGKLEERVDVDSAPPNYKPIVESFNASINALVKPVREAANALKPCVNGEVPNEVDSLPGDLQVFSDVINAIRDSLTAPAEPVEEVPATAEDTPRRDLKDDQGADYAQVKDALDKALENLDKGLCQVALGNTSEHQASTGEVFEDQEEQENNEVVAEDDNTTTVESDGLQEIVSISKQNSAKSEEACNLRERIRLSAEETEAVRETPTMTTEASKNNDRLSSAIDRIINNYMKNKDE